MEIFKYSPRIGSAPQIAHRTIATQFGDGYTQAVGDGINTKSESYPLEFVGSLALMREIADFIDRHAGYIPFSWTPPNSLAQKQWLAADGYTGPVRVGANAFTLSTTFKTFNQLPKP